MTSRKILLVCQRKSLTTKLSLAVLVTFDSFDSFSFFMGSFGFSWALLSWLSEIFEFFTVLQGELGPTVLQGELGPTGLKMGTLSFAIISL